MFRKKNSILRSYIHKFTLISILITFSFYNRTIRKFNTYTCFVFTTRSFMIMFVVITYKFIKSITKRIYLKRNCYTTISDTERLITYPVRSLRFKTSSLRSTTISNLHFISFHSIIHIFLTSKHLKSSLNILLLLTIFLILLTSKTNTFFLKTSIICTLIFDRLCLSFSTFSYSFSLRFSSSSCSTSSYTSSS